MCLQGDNIWVGNIFTNSDKLPGLGLFKDGIVTPVIEHEKISMNCQTSLLN